MAKVNNEIETLEFPVNIRTRPVMYMNDILHSDHALTETVDNAADHVFRDVSVTKIAIKTAEKPGEYFYVANDGSSFPIGFDEVYGRTKMHLAVDQMHSGSNFKGGDTSVGQNGVGLKGCNALSSRFFVMTLLNSDNYKGSSSIVNSSYNGKDKGIYYSLYYEQGVIVSERVAKLDIICKEYGIDLPDGYTTYVVSQPDKEIYEKPIAKLDEKRLMTSIMIFEKFYKRKIQYIFNNKQIKSSEIGYKYSTLVEYKIHGINDKGTKDLDNMVDCKILLNYEFDKDLEIMSSGGNVNTRNVPKGHHINEGRERVANALKRVFNIPHNHLQKGLKLDALVLAPGANLQLAGQTKDSLIRIKCFNEPEWDIMEKVVAKELKKNEDEISAHVQRLNEYAVTLDKLAAKDYVKSMLSLSKNLLPIVSRKVRDAVSKERDKCTLYIVEGNSAASALLEARDTLYDGVYAMRGFCLNTTGLSLEQLLENEEMRDLIVCFGCGVDAHNDISLFRYNKVVICTDADPDGAAISALLIGMFGRHLKFLIDAGKIFVNQSPLFLQNGKYLRPDEASQLVKTKPFTRFKGLGELDVDQAYDVFFGDHQRLLRITSEGVDHALDMMTSTEAKYKLMVDNGIIIE